VRPHGDGGLAAACAVRLRWPPLKRQALPPTGSSRTELSEFGPGFPTCAQSQTSGRVRDEFTLLGLTADAVSGARSLSYSGLGGIAFLAVADHTDAATLATVFAGPAKWYAAEGSGRLAGAAVLALRRLAEKITHALGGVRAWLSEADRVGIVGLILVALLLALLAGVAALLVALLLA
jgi:hypothetical protein